MTTAFSTPQPTTTHGTNIGGNYATFNPLAGTNTLSNGNLDVNGSTATYGQQDLEQSGCQLANGILNSRLLVMI